MLEVRLLGTFEVKYKKKAVSISSRPAQSLFAYLILSAGTSHRREKLAGLLWPDSLEETARDNLRHALWRIRKALDSASSTRFLHADDLTIKFEVSSDYWLDAAELQKLSESASADELIAVLSVYQGELLPGFYDEWVVLEREHLYSIFEHHMARLLALLQDDKRWQEVLDWAERWIKLGQKPEPAFRALMSANAAKGDMSKVAATYERCVKSLREFGFEPSEQTKDLYENLKLGKEIPRTVPVSMKLVAKEISSSIPIPLTSFIGREKELKEIARLLATSRLLTLTGPGGVGKTRLAIQTAHDSIKKFKDAVCWVELVGLQDGSLIPQEIAQALDVREVSNQPMMETLKTHLKSKGLLLVLDNCEHLIEACAQTVEGLLSVCLKLKILATSRERLDLFNETTWNVPSLPLPEMQQALSLKQLKEFASIQLFVERARNVKSDFVLTEQNASSIAQICNRLDGIPLAIELASARIKLLSVDEIASRLSDRFSLLTSGTRTALPRQQTLRAAIDWSHDLLTEPERILLRRLAVFAGGFTLDAVEVVCSAGMKRSDILDLLGRLVDKSLVVVETDSVLNETRYRLLETIRQYARLKLEEIGEVPEITEQHLNFFASFAGQAEKNLYGKEGSVWFLRLEKEIDNLRAAMHWSVSMAQKNQPKSQSVHKKQLLIVGSLDMFWETRYRNEILQVLGKLLASTKPNEPTIEKAKALSVGGFLLLSLHKFSEARVYLDESIEIAEKLGDPLTLAQSLGFLGWTFDFLGEYDHAKTSLEKSVTIARSLGEAGESIATRSLCLLGDIPYWQGRLFEARQIYEEAISILRETHDRNMLTYPLRRLGYICLREGDIDQAVAWFGESLEINHEIGHFPGMCACLAGFAAANLAKKNFDKSAMLCGYVENLLERIGAPFFFIDTVEYERTVSQLKRVITEKALAVAWSKGRAMTMEQAIQYALEETKI